MTWFKVDDSFYDHPKVYDAPDCALALWIRAGTWSARNLTDGFVPTGMPARLCGEPERAVKELLDRGLWERTRGGYRFHDWNHYQPTRQEAASSRDKMSSAGALGNHRRWHAKQGRTDPGCRYCVAEASGSGLPDSRPDALPDANPMSDSRRRGRQPDDWRSRSGQGGHRVPDRVPSGRPESPPNPPDPARPDLRGAGVGDPLTPGAREAPPPRCPEHLDNPTSEACGPCGDARRARNRWELADAERRRNAPKCRTHRGQPADNCGLCRSEQLAEET